MGVGGVATVVSSVSVLAPINQSVIKAEWIFICDQVYVYICKREQCVCVCVCVCVHACMHEREK